RRAWRGDDRPGADAGREAPQHLALEVEQLRQRLLHESARVEAVEPRAVLDPVERRRDVAARDHTLLGHEPEVAGDLAPRVGEDGAPLLGRAGLDVDEEDTAPAQGEGERDLAPDPPGAENGDCIHRLASPTAAARTTTFTPVRARKSSRRARPSRCCCA